MLVLDAGWIHASVLLWIRIGALLALTPFFALFKVATVFRVLLTLALAGTLAAGRESVPPSFEHPLQFIVAAASEALVGAMLGDKPMSWRPGEQGCAFIT